MKDVKINVYDLEKIFLKLRAQINLIDVWNRHEEESREIKLILENVQESLLQLENLVYDIDDLDWFFSFVKKCS